MLFIASDHAGVELKHLLTQYLTNQQIHFEDLGVHTKNNVDYPDIADTLCNKIAKNYKSNRGILICGSGIGMSIAANRYYNIRAALCTDPYMASVARKHNDANVLCLGARVIGIGVAETIVMTFLHESFEGGRHHTRIQKLTNQRSNNE